MPAFCPRCGDLLKGVSVCGKCQLSAVTTQSASFQTESGPAVELSPVHPPVEVVVAPPAIATAGSVRKLRKCGVCSNPIVGASSSTRSCSGEQVVCHDNCLSCKQCRQPIDASAAMAVLYRSAYHETCSIGLRVCHGCHEPIVGKSIDQDAISFHKVCHDKFVKSSAPAAPPGGRNVGSSSPPLCVIVGGIGQDSVQATNPLSTVEPPPPEVDGGNGAHEDVTTSFETGGQEPPSIPPNDAGIDHEPAAPSDVATSREEPVAAAEPTSPSIATEPGRSPRSAPSDPVDSPMRVWPLPPRRDSKEESTPPLKLDESSKSRATASGDVPRAVDCLSCGHAVLDAAIEVPSGSSYHEQCFVCTTCEQRIDDDGAGFVQDGFKIFHPHCYYEHAGRLCHGCHQVVEDAAVKQRDKGQLFHPHCFRCVECAAPLTSEYLTVDGDDLCRECYFHHVVAMSTTEYAATAVAPTSATDTCQLGIAVGDKLTVLSDDLGGWSLVKDANNLMGYIPSACVCRVG